MSISPLSGLNPEQLKAVTLPRQSALVLAGAGSGKTRVLTARIAHLIHTGAVSPFGLLAVTFTNKAAREMLTRLENMLPGLPRGMWVGTFHGLCNRLLRAHHREAGLPELFQIMDSQDQLAAIKRLLKSLNVDEEKYPARQLQYFINECKENGVRAARADAADDYARRHREWYGIYDAQCDKEGLVDFAELLLRTYELLERDEALREHYRQRFQYILVDEFQDTSRFQYLWLKTLAGRQNPVFAVGDDDQSIYAFRGAHPGNMQDFQRDFAISDVIKLEQNYRSQGNILDAANALIAHNRQRLGKNLWTAALAGEPIRVYEAISDQDEAQFIVDEVRVRHADGINLSEMGLLYRSNAQSRVLEHLLFSVGVPYRVYGGLRFFERKEIKHALAYLRLIANPDDNGSLSHIINFPPRGIGTRSLEQLETVAQTQGVSMLKAVQYMGEAKGSLKSFAALMVDLQQACATLPLPQQVDHVLYHSGLPTHYQKEKNGEERVENLHELVNAATLFAQEYRDNSPVEDRNRAGFKDVLTAFLSHASLEAGEHQAQEGVDALQLMTVHSAKGLEFDTVFMSGLEEGLFPHDNSLSDPDGLEEERRLMYVAITRAKKQLFISFAQSRMLHGQTRYGIASRFLGEIPAAFIKYAGASWRNLYTSLTVDPIPAPRAAAAVSKAPAFSIGQSVMHPKFGLGIIMNCEGRGADARVQVSFANAGVKWLALEYAKLSPG